MVCHIHDLVKSIQNCQIVPRITKILQNFWLTLVIVTINQIAFHYTSFRIYEIETVYYLALPVFTHVIFQRLKFSLFSSNNSNCFFWIYSFISTFFKYSSVKISFMKIKKSFSFSDRVIGNNLYSHHHLLYFSFLWKPLCWCYLATALKLLSSSTAVCH